MAGHGYAKIEYSEIVKFEMGMIPVVVGRIVGFYHEEDGGVSSGPIVYGAALSERDLRNEQCGYGTSQSEAVADLFRLMSR